MFFLWLQAWWLKGFSDNCLTLSLTLRWKGVDPSFMGVAHSCRDACDAKDAPPQQPQHEKAIELPEADQVIRVTQEGCAHGTDSKIRRSFLLERKLYTDTEIMRGTSWCAHCKLRVMVCVVG